MISLAILLLGAVQLSSSAIQYQTCTKLWKKVGCRADLHYNLTVIIDDRTKNIIEWDKFSAYEHDLLCRCRQAAVASGYKWFAMDNHGLCSVTQQDFASYLRQYPLDDQAKCSGLMAQVPVAVPDGSNCIDGRYRPFFYTIETSVAAPIGGAPVGGAPEQEVEEEGEKENVGSAPAQEVEEQEVVASCQTVADVVLIIDVSGSVTLEGFKKTQTFIKNFMDRFDFTNGTRIGIVTYDEICQQILDWTTSALKSKAQLKAYTDALQYTGGSTRTDLALGCAKNSIVQPQKRANVPITVVCMTDGMTWGGASYVEGPANALRSLGAKVIAIGVGTDIDPNELNSIAGQVADNVILKETFLQLSGPNFLNSLIGKSCS